MLKLINNKSQEEMIGFVLIIVLVAVIALVFLAISLRKPAETQLESKDIRDFLHSSLIYTTSCKKSPEITYNLQDLIKACGNNDKCLDEKDSCSVLNDTIFNLIESSWQVGEEARYKGYDFKIFNEDSVLISLSKGNSTKTKTGGEAQVLTDKGLLDLRLELFS